MPPRSSGSIEGGKKIIISTIQKFPFVVDEIGTAHRGRSFAIIIDEAHSSQGGRTALAMSTALSAVAAAEDEDPEDRINRVMESRKMLPNASYFAFTETPKNKTLEIFGKPEPQPDSKVRHRPFHSYTMKQAIQEASSSMCCALHTELFKQFGDNTTFRRWLTDTIFNLTYE